MDRQNSFITHEYKSRKKKTRKQIFLEKMEEIIPWARWLKMIEEALPKAPAGRRPYPTKLMFRTYLIQIWFNLSDEGTEDAMLDSAPIAYFAGIEHFGCGVPDATTLCRFRNALVESGVQEKIMRDQDVCLREMGLSMSRGTIVDATIIEAPSSTMNKTKSRDPEMHSTKKGNQWHFGMKEHIGVDMDNGMLHTAIATAANVSDIAMASQLLRDEDEVMYGDAGYIGLDNAEKHPEMRDENGDMKVKLRVNARRHAMKKKHEGKMYLPLLLAGEQALSSVRAKVEHPNHWLKCVCDFCKAVYKGLKKNHARACIIFASMNMWRLPKLLECRA